ncbi:MAG: thioesterase family protein [Actinomycetota bacterium]|nr:thioesterase family protein [Actinomycetota bacterium]
MPEAWLDYNGHMHDADYLAAISMANEELFAALDLSADYRRSTGASFYTVEYHLRFLAECALGDVLRASTTLVTADARRLRFYTELEHADGRVAGTGESLYLHVDPRRGGVVAMPEDRARTVAELHAAHAGLPRPAYLGAGVGASR